MNTVNTAFSIFINIFVMILKQVNANAQFAIILSATLWFLYINILNYNFCRIGHPGFIRNGKKRTEILKNILFIIVCCS